MTAIPTGVDINPHYITDGTGKTISVILSVSEFDAMLEVFLKTIEPRKETIPDKRNAARFKGLLTAEEAKAYQAHLKKARSEWDRDI